MSDDEVPVFAMPVEELDVVAMEGDEVILGVKAGGAVAARLSPPQTAGLALKLLELVSRQNNQTGELVVRNPLLVQNFGFLPGRDMRHIVLGFDLGGGRFQIEMEADDFFDALGAIRPVPMSEPPKPN